MGWITVLALIGLVLLTGVIALALKAALKGKQAHTERVSSQQLTPPSPSPLAPPPSTLASPEPLASPPAQSTLVEVAETPAAEPAAADASPPQGKVRALVTYRKANGSCSEREVVLYSQVMQGGTLHAVTVREPDVAITKKFLVSGLERLKLLDATPERILDSPAEIRRWIETNLPLKGDRSVGKRTRGVAIAQSALARKPAFAPVAKPLPTLLPDGAKGFAVFDLETTGRDPSACSIVEIGLVCVDHSGQITETWETLLNPGCTIPTAASAIHQIGNRDVAKAPSFSEISALLAAKLHQHVLVAHNLSYDFPILERHFKNHSEQDVDLGVGICTLRGFGGDPAHAYSKKLQHLCSFHGVAFDPRLAHTALGDVLPLAQALIKGIPHLEPSSAAVSAPQLQSVKAPVQVWTRSMLAMESESSWEKSTLPLRKGLCFVTTGPRSMQEDTPIIRAAAHAEGLGLMKLERLTKKNPPDFLLSTSLSLDTAKMSQARERRIPIVLIEDLNRFAVPEGSVEAWLFAD